MASADQRVAELRLRFKTEKQSLEATKRDLNSFQQSFDQFKVESEKTNRALEQQVRILQAEKAAASDSRKAIADFAKEQRRVTVEAEKAANAIKKEAAAQDNLSTSTKRGAALQAFGREARLAVPAIGIPGTGVGSESVFRGIEIAGKLGASLDQLVIGFGALTIAGTALFAVFSAFKDSQERIKQGYITTIQNEEKLNELRVTGTTDVIQAQLEAFRIQQRIAELNLKTVGISLSEELKRVGTENLGFNAFLGLFGLDDARLAGASEEAVKALANYKLVTNSIAIYEEALGTTEVATNDAAAAEDKLAAARQKAIDLRVASEIKAELEVSSLSAEAIRQRIDAINQEIKINYEKIRSENLSAEMTDRLTQRTNELVAALPTYIDALPGAEEAERIKSTADAVKQFNEDITKLTEQRAQQEAAIYQRLNDSIIKATEQAADAAEKALQSLQNRRADLATDLSRDERDANRKAEFERLNDQIKAQEDEAKSYRDHLRSLRQIREDSQAQEFDLVLNRDFAGLRRLRQDTARRLQEESRSFTEQKSERQLALVQQAKDDQRQREFERQQRLVRYQDALADADLQARRELQQIEQNKRRELQRLAVAANQELSLLNQKYVAELTGRRNAVQAELSIIGQGYSARLQQDANYVNALLAQGRLLQAGGLFGLFGTAAAPLLSSNRSAVNTNNFNITTGANPAQQQSLVTLIENVVARSFARIAQ